MLRGSVVRLEPLAGEHAEDLYAAGQDPAIWRYKFRGPFASVADAREWCVDVGSRWRRAADEGGGSRGDVAFAIVHLATGRAIGSTRYMDIRPGDRSLEIGATFVAPAHQRTAVNTECKLLLLRHAFATLGALRVALKTDTRNVQSMRAIERLGAQREGVLRRHRVLPDGYARDTVYYSVLDDEWPQVRDRLGRLLRR